MILSPFGGAPIRAAQGGEGFRCRRKPGHPYEAPVILKPASSSAFGVRGSDRLTSTVLRKSLPLNH